MGSIREVTGFVADKVAVAGDVSFYENVMDWIDTSGQAQHVEQVVVATWRDGKIVHERFYYAG